MSKVLARFFMCALVIPSAARAQGSVEIGSLFAFYAPAGSYHHPAGYFRAGTPQRPSDNGGPAWGVEGRLWVNRRLGVQLQGVTSSADHGTFYTPGGGAIASSTRVTSVTAQAVYLLSPASTARRFWLSAGGGMIRHSGSSYVVYGSLNDPVGALGLGSSIPLWHGLAANLGVSSLLYHWDLRDENGLYQRGFQTDVLAHAGLTLTLR